MDAKTHKAKTCRCAVLDNASFGPLSAPLSYPLHIPQRAGIQSSSRGLRRAARSIDLGGSDVFWRGFAAVRNNGAACRLALVSTIEHIGVPATRRLRGYVPETKNDRGRNDCASILRKTLDEEKETDKKLTALAESKVNLRAAS